MRRRVLSVRGKPYDAEIEYVYQNSPSLYHTYLINTGDVPTFGYSYEIGFLKETSYDCHGGCIIGAIKRVPTRVVQVYNLIDQGMRFWANSSNIIKALNSTSEMVKYELKLDFTTGNVTSNLKNASGEYEVVASANVTSLPDCGPFGLMARPTWTATEPGADSTGTTSESGIPGDFRLYYYRKLNNTTGKYEKNLIPVIKDGCACMYDKVNKVFYKAFYLTTNNLVSLGAGPRI